jgi:hypothetical protein
MALAEAALSQAPTLSASRGGGGRTRGELVNSRVVGGIRGETTPRPRADERRLRGASWGKQYHEATLLDREECQLHPIGRTHAYVPVAPGRVDGHRELLAAGIDEPLRSLLTVWHFEREAHRS